MNEPQAPVVASNELFGYPMPEFMKKQLSFIESARRAQIVKIPDHPERYYVCGLCGKRIPIIPRGGMVKHVNKHRADYSRHKPNPTGQATATKEERR